MPLYELIYDISVRPPWNNLWCTNYSSVRTNTRFTVVNRVDIDQAALMELGLLYEVKS